MNNSNKMIFLVALLVAGIIYIKAELSEQASLDQLLKSDTPIVYFDGLDIFSKTHEVQDTKIGLERKFQEDGKNVQKLNAEAEKAAADLKNMGSIATEHARRSKQEEVLEKQNKVAVKERSLQQYAQEEMQRAEYEMAQKLKAYATKVAKEEGYSLVLAGGVAYGDPKLNISDKIVAKWNSEYDAHKKNKTA